MSLEDHWDDIYRRRGPEGVSWHQQDPSTSMRLIAEAVPGPEATMVDVGGGSSRLVDRLVAAGFGSVTVADVSATALAFAQERLGPVADRVAWVHTDVRAWRPEQGFDLWHDRAVFHFMVDAEDRRRYVETMRRAVAPGGAAIVATFALDGPERCSGLPVQRYGRDELAAVFADFMAPEAFEGETHITPAGVEQRFLYGVFRRPSGTPGD